MLTRDELQAVADVAIEHDLVVVTDEVYEHLVFDDHEHVPLATLPGHVRAHADPLQRRQVLLLHRLEGRLGDRAAELVGAVLAAKQWLTFTSGAPLQPAVAHALDDEPASPPSWRAACRSAATCSAPVCAGSASTCASPKAPTSPLTDIADLGWADGMAFCLALPERAGVVAIPAQVFYDDLDAGRHLVRWAFCKEAEVIEEGISRLAGADLKT